MNTRLYVGNLDYSVTGDRLNELFSKAGTVVSADVVSFKDTGRSKGFGFVEMGSEGEAKAAIEMFNDKEHEGRKMVVNEARPREERE